jgi:hypothetical protein
MDGCSGSSQDSDMVSYSFNKYDFARGEELIAGLWDFSERIVSSRVLFNLLEIIIPFK